MVFIKTMAHLAHIMISTILHKELTTIVLCVLLIFRLLNMVQLLIYVKMPVFLMEMT